MFRAFFDISYSLISVISKDDYQNIQSAELDSRVVYWQELAAADIKGATKVAKAMGKSAQGSTRKVG